MRYVRRIKTIGIDFITCGKHIFTHILIGLVYAWFLREWWQELSIPYTVLAAFGSVMIDLDHVIYFFTYGRKEWYAQEVRKLLKQGQLRSLMYFLKTNHKYNAGLATHNIYFLAGFFLLSLVSFQFDWKSGVVIFGAIVLHLLLDILDDLWVLGYLNPNWKRLRRIKNSKSLAYIHDTSAKSKT